MKNNSVLIPYDNIPKMDNYNPNTKRPDLNNNRGLYSVLFFDEYHETLQIYQHKSLDAAEARLRSLMRNAQRKWDSCRILMVNDLDQEVQEVTIEQYT